MRIIFNTIKEIAEWIANIRLTNNIFGRNIMFRIVFKEAVALMKNCTGYRSSYY